MFLWQPSQAACEQNGWVCAEREWKDVSYFQPGKSRCKVGKGAAHTVEWWGSSWRQRGRSSQLAREGGAKQCWNTGQDWGGAPEEARWTARFLSEMRKKGKKPGCSSWCRLQLREASPHALARQANVSQPAEVQGEVESAIFVSDRLLERKASTKAKRISLQLAPSYARFLLTIDSLPSPFKIGRPNLQLPLLLLHSALRSGWAWT